MRNVLRSPLRLAAIGTVLLAAVGAATTPASASVPPSLRGVDTLRPCATTVRTGHVRCLATTARVLHKADGTPAAPDGLGAPDLRSAYRLPSGGAATTVGIVLWHDAPFLERDLNAYRSYYGLGTCTRASGCLTVVNQRGKTAPLPREDENVAVETDLDTQMVSAACPRCRIVVVEADEPETPDLAAAERTATRLGATVVSNSFGGPESSDDLAPATAGAFRQRGVVTVASSGDSGFGDPSWPATDPGVVAVGGTVLTKADNARGWSEKVWPGASTGCSGYQAKPAWQRDALCPNRLTTDVSAVADGVAVSYLGYWLTVGGTSVSAPLVAGMYGSAGNATAVRPGDLYRHTSRLFDVTAGTNDFVEDGKACGYTYLCVATKGYDAPTGLGTPNGLGAF